MTAYLFTNLPNEFRLSSDRRGIANEIETNDIKVSILSGAKDRRAELFSFAYIIHELFHGTKTTMSIRVRISMHVCCTTTITVRRRDGSKSWKSKR